MTLTPQETVDRMARADEQSKALKAWQAAGGDLAAPRTPRPDTPDLDAINAEYEAKQTSKEATVTKPIKGIAKQPPTTAKKPPAAKAAPKPKTAPTPEPKAITAAATTATGRLAPGALQTQVHEFLQRRARQTEGFSPSAIGKALDRSSGAIANALDKMVAEGTARLLSPKPKRYAIVGKSARKAS